MTLTIADRHLRVRSQLDARRADPLRWWRFGFQGDALDRIRVAFGLLAADDGIDELHLRACNKGTKTETKAAYMLAALQKRPMLDGVPIPQWRGRVEGLQLVLDYPQQLLSVKAAYLRLLGDWPAHVRYEGEYLKSIHVMPVGGDPDDESAWSLVYFMSQKNWQSGTGARADIVDFDEPPKMDILRELRKAAHAGRRCVILIGETPTKRREWAPLRDDYGETPRRTLRRVDRERAEIRWSLDEVADWVLSVEEKAKLRRIYERDPLRAAREHGDYANTEGLCPFDQGDLAGVIERMIAAWCRDPIIKHIPVQIESAGGAPKLVTRVPVEVWTIPRRNAECYQAIDPASGVDDNAHNPAALHMSDDDTGELYARWNGYMPPYSVGALAAALHRHYNHAWTDVEMKDHWGVNVMRGYEDNGGTKLCYEERELRPGVFAKEVGFDVKHETRSIWVGCIQEWIAAFAAGEPYAPCPSRAVFDTLLDTELDDRGFVIAGPGIAHGEDFVLLGQKLRRVKRPMRETPQHYEPPPSEAEVYRAAKNRIAAMITSGEDPDDRDFDEIMVPRMERPKA